MRMKALLLSPSRCLPNVLHEVRKEASLGDQLESDEHL